MWTSMDVGEQVRTSVWCPGAESNHRHCDFQSHALPTELPGLPRARGPGERAVYSQAKRTCPPSFACGYAWRGLASLHRQIAGKSRLFSVFAVIRDGESGNSRVSEAAG